MTINSRLRTALILVPLILLFLAGTVCSAQDPTELLKSAQDAARLAVTSGVSSTDAKAFFEQSIKDYKDILTQYKDTPQAADALVELGDVQDKYINFLKSDDVTEPVPQNNDKPANSPEGLLEQARLAVAKTKKPGQSTDDLNAEYKNAIEAYNKLIKKDWTVESAVARLELAELLANATPKHQNMEQAYKALRQLIMKYDIPAADLQTKIVAERSVSSEQATAEAAQIVATVQKGKDYKEVVLKQWKEVNSKKFEYKIMDFFVGLTGHRPGFSYWLAIVLITIVVKVAITPLTKAQFKSMKEMQKVAPLIKEVQAKHKGDQKAIGEKTMAIYKDHKISPFASCLPLLIQMPILMGLFYTIKSYEPQFVNGHFLWIGSTAKHLLELPVPALFNTADKVFLPAMNLSEPDLVLVVLYVVSMYFSTKLSSADPSQAEQQKMMSIMMPLMFAFMFAGFPSAFLLYWLLFNVMQTVHQVLILRSKEPSTQPSKAPAKS